MESDTISTARLVLLESSLDIELATIRDVRDVTRLTGFSIADDWPGPDWREALVGLIDAYKSNPDWCRWNRLIVHRADNTLIGGIGCVFPPDEDGSVTIGFYTAPSYRRQGFMLEAARAYVSWLQGCEAVKIIRADCLVHNAASIRILTHLGFRESGRYSDEEGSKIAWQL